MVTLAPGTPSGCRSLPRHPPCAAAAKRLSRWYRAAAAADSSGAHRCGMGPYAAAPAAAETTDRTTTTRPPHSAQWDPSGGGHGLVVAGDAEGIRQAGPGVQAISAVVRPRALVTHRRGIGRPDLRSVPVGALIRTRVRPTSRIAPTLRQYRRLLRALSCTGPLLAMRAGSPRA